MCQDDHPAALPPACCGAHDTPDHELAELGFQIVYAQLLAAEPTAPHQENAMPARAA